MTGELTLSPGTGHGRADAFIDKAGVQRRVRLRVPHFGALADVLESSDLVATVPEVFARRSSQRFQLDHRPHPVDLPPIEIRAFWHAKLHQDPANRWLRGLLVRQFADAGNARRQPAAD